MTNFEERNVAENLIDSFDLREENNNDLVTLKVIAVGGASTLTAHIGDTIGEVKAENGYDETIKVTNSSGILLNEDFVVKEDMTLYVSVPKQNG